MILWIPNHGGDVHLLLLLLLLLHLFRNGYCSGFFRWLGLQYIAAGFREQSGAGNVGHFVVVSTVIGS